MPIMTTWLRAAIVSVAALAPTGAVSDGLVEYKALSPGSALELAQTTLDACRKAGFQVGVAVVDRSGVLQVFLRDQYAGAHTLEFAERKAWTAASFRTDTVELSGITAPDTTFAGIRNSARAMALGGGVPVEAAGSMVGAVGVSGASTPEADHDCALVGIEAIAETLEF